MFREATETDTLAGLSSAGAGKRIHSRISVSAAISPYVISKSPGESIPSTDTSAVAGGGAADGTHFVSGQPSHETHFLSFKGAGSEMEHTF